MVHRGLKPQNIIAIDRNRVKIIRRRWRERAASRRGADVSRAVYGRASPELRAIVRLDEPGFGIIDDGTLVARLGKPGELELSLTAWSGHHPRL